MKKIMSLLVAVALAAGVQAMSVDWKLSGDTSVKGYTAYAILSSTVQDTWVSVDDVVAAAISVGGSGVFSGSRSISAGASAKDVGITKDSANIYFVIVNTDQTEFAVTAVSDMTAFVYDADNQETSSGAYQGAATSLNYKPFGGNPPPGGVPEPTSGLLLLVGGAALALRRKQK